MTASNAICLLGGTGFVGSRLASRLIDLGYRVIVPTRHPQRNRHLLVLPQLELVAADIHDPAILARLLNDCGQVVNLVGILNERGRNGSGFRRAHAELAATIVTACQNSGVSKLVQLSALQASASGAPSHYLRTKGEAEDIITAAGNLDWTVLRPSVIFGPGDSFTNRFAALLRNLPLIFPLAMPATRFAPVHVDDVVDAILVALTASEANGQIYELCGPANYSLKELVKLIANACGLKRYVWGLPRWLSRLQASIMDFVPGKPFSTDNYRSLTVDSLCSENGMQRLGLQARSLPGALPDCLSSWTERHFSNYRRVAGR